MKSHLVNLATIVGSMALCAVIMALVIVCPMLFLITDSESGDAGNNRNRSCPAIARRRLLLAGTQREICRAQSLDNAHS